MFIKKCLKETSFITIFRLKKVKAIFVIGIPVIVNGSQMEVDNETQTKLKLESLMYKDILQVN
jgi:hypothetical protein